MKNQWGKHKRSGSRGLPKKSKWGSLEWNNEWKSISPFVIWQKNNFVDSNQFSSNQTEDKIKVEDTFQTSQIRQPLRVKSFKVIKGVNLKKNPSEKLVS